MYVSIKRMCVLSSLKKHKQHDRACILYGDLRGVVRGGEGRHKETQKKAFHFLKDPERNKDIEVI